MYDFCSHQIPGFNFFFVASQADEGAETFLSGRFININTQSKIQDCPIAMFRFLRVKVRKYSTFDNFDIVNIIKPIYTQIVK